jgi:hypothetical protein
MGFSSDPFFQARRAMGRGKGQLMVGRADVHRLAEGVPVLRLSGQRK